MERYGWDIATIDALGDEGRERVRRGLATRDIYLDAMQYRKQWETTQATTTDNMRALGLRS